MRSLLPELKYRGGRSRANHSVIRQSLLDWRITE
jgi:hypothetical protein